MVKLELFADDVVNALCDIFSWTSKSEVINLSQHADRDVVDSCFADASIVCGGCEAEFWRRKDGVDMIFPWATGFRVPLQCMQSWEDAGLVQTFPKAFMVPVSARVVNGNVGGFLGRRRVCTGIFSVATAHFAVEAGRECEEQSLNRLFNAG